MMVRFLYIIIIFLKVSHAQDNLHDAMSFYPLNNGDYWEFREDFWDYSFPPFYHDSTFYSIRVVGDTVLSNNQNYKILERRKIPDTHNPFYYFERIDSTTANVYRYLEHYDLPNNEYLIDSLGANVGDFSKSTRDESHFKYRHTECLFIDTLFVLGKETIVKTFEDQSYIPGFRYEIAKDLGYIGDLNCEFSCGSTILLYAKINGVEYGNKVLSIQQHESPIMENFQLYQNYPNPFNPSTIITFYIPSPSEVIISVYDIEGRLVENILSHNFARGLHSIEFNGSKMATGQYFYILKTQNVKLTRKFSLIK